MIMMGYVLGGVFVAFVDIICLGLLITGIVWLIAVHRQKSFAHRVWGSIVLNVTVVTIIYFVNWLLGYPLDSNDQKASHFIELPEEAHVVKADVTSWDSAVITFTLPETRSHRAWIEQIWVMNQAKYSQPVAPENAIPEDSSGRIQQYLFDHSLRGSISLSFEPSTHEYCFTAPE